MTLAKGMLRLHVTDERAPLVNGKYDVNSTKYTFFHTSVSDATADAIRRNNGDSRDQLRKSDIISTSLAASTALSKRSYLYWSVPDRSEYPKHYLLTPRGSVRIAPGSKHVGLMPSDPLGYDGLITASLVIKQATPTPSEKALSNLKYAKYSEGIVLARRRPSSDIDMWLTSSSAHHGQIADDQPIFFSSTVACYQNCGGKRRYKSSAYIDLFAHSPAVYSVACYAQSCRCSLCCDKTIVETVIARHLIKPNTWHRQKIDAVPVSFSLCAIWNFQFLDSESKHDKAKKKKSAQPCTTTTTLTSLAHRPSQLNNDTNNNNVKGENVNVEIGGKIGNVNGISSPQERRYVQKLSIENSDDPHNNNKSKAATPQSAAPKKKIADEQRNSSKSNGQVNSLTTNGYGRVHETDL